MHESGTQLYTLWRKQRKLRVQLVLALVVVVGLAIWLEPHLLPARTTTEQQGDSSSQTTPKLTKGTPNFKTFVPAGKNIEDYGGWTRVSPASSAAVYAYSDNIAGSTITVSQQQLPDSFKGSVSQKIKQLQSDQQYVTQHIIDVDDLTIYVGISAKNYQSTIFVKDDILVLITSYRTINDTAITQYIRSLE